MPGKFTTNNATSSTSGVITMGYFFTTIKTFLGRIYTHWESPFPFDMPLAVSAAQGFFITGGL
jgi:hypothetical protein